MIVIELNYMLQSCEASHLFVIIVIGGRNSMAFDMVGSSIKRRVRGHFALNDLSRTILRECKVAQDSTLHV